MDMSYLFAHVFMYFSFKFVPFAQYDMYVAVVLFAVAVIVYCLVLPTTFYTKSRLALGALLLLLLLGGLLLLAAVAADLRLLTNLSPIHFSQVALHKLALTQHSLYAKPI